MNLDCPSTIRDYLLRCARSPRAGGTFDHVTASLRLLPDSLLLSALLRSRYSGLVFTRGEEVIGHVLDQQHGDTLHAFSIAVNAPLRKLCYAQVMLMDYVAYASQRDDIAALRLGRARNPFTRELLKTLGEHQQQLGWSVSADGWIEFSRSR
ncbi:MAG TPA: hypothetical protein VHY33_00070 [Thermoanaerobaculia bacterium]|nr:hypothetical protein [Thermoanaerobaculia bacterium]